MENQNKPSLLKIIIGIALFPFTITYLIWKSNWDIKVKIGAIAGFWIVFALIGTFSKSTSTETVNTKVADMPTSAPTVVPTVSLEQKQADFKEFYTNYKKQAQGMILIQQSIVSIAERSTDKADLYLNLEKVEKMQSNIASSNLDIKIPDSLKEYKQLSLGLTDFKIGGNNYTDAIKYFKEYVNSDDMKKLSDAKNQIERGNTRLTDSKEKIDSVASELGIEITDL